MNINFNTSLLGGIQQYDDDNSSKLTALGIPANIVAQGQSAIEKYAQEHGITLPSKQQTKQTQQPMFGQINQSGNQQKEDIETKLKALGIPSDIIAQGKTAVENYAAQNNITLPTPPAQGSKLNVMA